MKVKEIRDKFIPFMDLTMEFYDQGGDAKVIGATKIAVSLVVGFIGGYGRHPIIDFSDEDIKKIKYALAKMALI